MKTDHERIWLQNAEDAAQCSEGRMWCQEKVWPIDKEDGEPTEYVRADLLETKVAEARGAALEEAAALAEGHGVHQELNVWAGGPEWYKYGKAIATAIRALIAPAKREDTP